MESKKLIIDSKLEALDQVYTWLKKILEPITTEKIKDNILLITYEIVTNSIIHGNKKDPSKSVNINLNITENQIIITVKDEGSGYEGLPSKEEAQNLNYLEEGGRGLKLAMLICDDIELNNNSIKLVFNRETKEK
ncbi:ATP-binding protein [bacterium]|nr:ATP-binding protein [bacterium]MBU1958849.1 ATP-binding protein [bacterium]